MLGMLSTVLHKVEAVLDSIFKTCHLVEQEDYMAQIDDLKAANTRLSQSVVNLINLANAQKAELDTLKADAAASDASEEIATMNHLADMVDGAVNTITPPPPAA